MSFLKLHDTGGYRYFDEEECRAAGEKLASIYSDAEPFPHIIIDEFLDGAVLSQIADSFPSSEGKSFFNRDQERLKFQYQPAECSSPLVRNLLAELNGRAFLAFLKELTGLSGLISDPYYSGGGLHEIMAGGHLGVHADFNVHDEMKVERRLNLLIYLNKDWADSYGGHLELWDCEMKTCQVRIAPVIGRAVIFSTNLDSFHGHPDPLRCPETRSRRSLVTYYYTALEDGLSAVPRRTTNFQARPQSNDRTDWQIRKHHFINDWVPPKLQRIARRLL